MSAFGFVRRVLDRGLAQVEFLLVNLLDHGLGVGHAAVLQEPARRLRDSAAHQDHDQTQNRTGRLCRRRCRRLAAQILLGEQLSPPQWTGMAVVLIASAALPWMREKRPRHLERPPALHGSESR